MRLIDADALSQHFAAMQECVSIRDHMYLMGVLSIIDRAPDVDAAPVVHARWLTSSDIPDTLICSLCGRRFDMYHFDQKDMPFCLCGAKMDGGNC